MMFARNTSMCEGDTQELLIQGQPGIDGNSKKMGGLPAA